MIKQKQLFKHNPEQGTIGDCWRTTIACILNRHPSKVPHFVQEAGWENYTGTLKATEEWLNSQGYALVEVAYNGSQPDDLKAVLQTQEATHPDLFYILSGSSRNGTNHSVIALGNRIYWDPAIDDSGIVGPMDNGYYFVTYLTSILHKATDAERMA